MKFFAHFFILIFLIINVKCEKLLPTLYEYYIGNDNKIINGLQENGTEFSLNNKPLVIYSGSLHYFRIVPEYWRQTIRKFKAAGLNTVQFYTAWNLHEPVPGVYDFESYGKNLTKFLQLIREEEMFAIVRPGPYICAEWDLGGHPSWLLRDDQMQLRSSYKNYLLHVRRYFKKLFKILNKFQFKQNNVGGPIIALQIENELFGDPDSFNNKQQALKYLENLHRIIVNENNFQEFLFTSDPVTIAQQLPVYSLKYLLETANLNQNAYESLMKLRMNQSNRPIFVTEFWPGWFDQWGNGQTHHRYSSKLFEQQISDILFKVNGSVNFYMFIGGTNFAFYNGARVTTSYDYDAPLNESGNYTDKYFITLKLYRKLIEIGRQPSIFIPNGLPDETIAQNYGKYFLNEYLKFNDIINQLQPIQMANKPLYMEYLQNSTGFGFILYRLRVKKFKTMNITGPIKDRAIIMINDKILAIINDGAKNFNISFNNYNIQDENETVIVDILVENLGRTNWAIKLMNNERKGINSTILLDGKIQFDQIQIYTFDFDKYFINSIDYNENWKNISNNFNKDEKPKLYRTKFTIIGDDPSDTFLKFSSSNYWTFGNIFVNYFNLGRFDFRGPQKTLYIPGPLLRQGENVIHLFNLNHRNPLNNNNYIELIDYPILI